MKKVALFIIIFAAFSCTASDKLYELEEETLSIKQQYDLESITQCRNGLSRVISYMNEHPEIFSAKKLKKSRMLSHDLRETALITWQTIIEYYFALDSIQSFHGEFLLLKDRPAQNKSFHLSAYSFTTEYRYALEIIDRLENNPHFDILFNEPIDEMGLPDGMYNKFKFRFLNVATAARFASFEAGCGMYKNENHDMQKKLNDDRKVILKKARQGAPVMTVENGLNMIKNTNDKLIFPIQKGISTIMGDTKVYRIHKYLITEKQIHSFMNLLEPGDILLERREWYLTNVGIPGFWTHAALYVGNQEQRETYFNKDEEVSMWLAEKKFTSYENYLQTSYPEKYSNFNSTDSENNPFRVIESVSEGVIFTTIEHSAGCDSIAILRPVLSKKEKAIAISRAFNYAGRPYDFDFNFESDSTLVCTELVYKSYEKGHDIYGLKLPLEDILGRKLLSANTIAKVYDAERKKGSEQLKFVLFYDGNEKKKKAFLSTENEFRQSWKRPKWHIITQN